MTDPKPVELTEAEREALFKAGDHHPDQCDCTAFADEVGYVPGSEICDALADTYDVVARIKAAARREALLEAREDIRTRRRTFAGLNADPQYLAAMDDAFGLVNNRLQDANRALAEPERDEEPCSCGSREATSLTPGEWLHHSPDGCTIERDEESGR